VTRRKFFYSMVGAAAIYPAYIEPRWLRVVQTSVKLSHAPRLRILHVSDLHLSSVVPLSLIDTAISQGLALRPDIVCVTGDFITGKEDLRSGAYARTLSRLSAASPTFAVLGNHDGGLWADAYGGHSDHIAVAQTLQSAGIRLLHNQSHVLQVRDARMNLVGVGDLWADEIDAKRAFSGLDNGKPIVLLSHNPDSKDVLGDHPWDLMLSGHTHGGQVILPFDGPRFAPVVDKRYVAGLGAWGERQIHVSRGVGNLHGVRFQCRPEINLLTLS
jgi:predicted MPP superfamily phosphohydrolase